MSLSSIYRPNEDISNPSLESVLAKLAVMNTDQLKAFAAQNQDDMIMLGAAQAVHAKREEFAQRANAPQGGNMPPVNQQVVQNMDPAPQMPQGMPQGMPPQGMPPQGGQLPEQQGIAQLPAPNIQNMAGGGIVAFADGGYADEDMRYSGEPVMRMADGGYVPRYQNFGAVNAPFEDAFLTTLRYEGGYVKDDAGKGPSNFGINKSANPDVDIENLTKEQARNIYKKRYWDAIGGDSLAAKNPALAKVAFDTAVNMGVGKAKQLVSESKGDPSALLAMRQQHYDNLIKKDPEKFSPYAKGWRDRVSDLATSVIPSAQAGELPKAAPKDLVSQIPGQRMQAPASTYDQQNSYFGRLADRLGIPQEYQRNIANTLNATSGFTSPISTVNRAVGTTSKALEATPEMIDRAQRAKQIAETPRLLPPAKAGLEALDEASQATRASAEAARRARNLEQDVQAARAAEQSVNAANMTSKIARTTEEGIAAIPNAQALNAAKAANASKALAGTQLAEEKVKGLLGESAAYDPNKMTPVRADEFGTAEAPAEAAPKPSDVLAATKQTVPAKERKGFDNEDLLLLGLNLMANKSPRFLTALGEAGIQTLSSKKEREKRETDLEYKDIMKKYYGALGTKAEAESKNLEAGIKYNAAARQHAMDNIQREMSKWYSTLGGMNPTPQEEEAKRASLVRQYFPLAGLEVPSTIASTAGVAIPEGVKVTRG